MGLHIGGSNQLRDVENPLGTSFYKNPDRAARKSICTRFTRWVVGVASGLPTVATRVALIADNIFKGIVNITGCGGNGAEKEIASAYQLFLEAAALGDPRAIHLVGGFHFAGYHVQKDVEKACEYFERAANLGFAPSMTVMGSQCLKDDDVQAFRWFEQAAAQDDPEGLVCGAKMVALGMGGNQPDLDKASAWFKRAYDLGDESAAHYLEKIDLYLGNDPSEWTDIKDKSEEPGDVDLFLSGLFTVYLY